MEILILGHTGLLGNMVKSYFDHCNIKTKLLPSNLRWNSLEFKNFIIDNKFDFIINCIGSIPQRTKDFSLNHELPIWLDENANCKVVHPGTDCEMDSDDYGISKKIARDHIVNKSKNTKIIKTSIIGTELNSSWSLMGWFLSNKDNTEVKGFTNHMWNGNTTLTWAKFCLDLIQNWDKYKRETILYSNCISKYDILTHINKTFNRDIKILSHESLLVDKCLIGDIKTDDISIQIEELKNFIK
jgi:dTDP-4-dehydrorhamnose reductase